MEIVPAIMPNSFEELKEQVNSVRGAVKMVQVHVMDGRFTEKKTWPYINWPDPDFEKISKEEEGFPFFEELDFEVDLMIKNPESVYYDWVTAGAKRIIIHIESTHDFKTILSDFKSRVPGKDSILHTELGLAINIDTPEREIEDFIYEVDFVQCMGIAKIGFQGQEFDERVIEKIKELRQKYPELVISVDGGVSLETAPSLVESGANRLAVGSAIFGNEDVRGVIGEFKNIG